MLFKLDGVAQASTKERDLKISSFQQNYLEPMIAIIILLTIATKGSHLVISKNSS